MIISEPTERERSYRYVIQGRSGIYENKRFLLYVRKDAGEQRLFEYGDVIRLRRRVWNSGTAEKLQRV